MMERVESNQFLNEAYEEDSLSRDSLDEMVREMEATRIEPGWGGIVPLMQFLAIVLLTISPLILSYYLSRSSSP